MLTFILTTIVFYLTRQIIRSDSKGTQPDTQTRYLSRDTFDETPYLDPAKVLAIDLTKLLP